MANDDSKQDNVGTSASKTAASVGKEKVQDLSAGLHQAVDKAASVAHGAADRAASRGQQLMDSQQQWVESTCEYVREKPFTAVGIAFAAGFIISRLSR